MIVRELLTKLNFSVDNAQLNKYERGVTNIKSRADEAANSFRNMFAAFLGFQGLKSLANTADEMQNLESRISLLPQTIGTAGEAFDMVAKKATESRTSIEAYGKLYVRLAGATKNFLTTQEEVFQVTSAISDALIVGGANTAEAASATLQLSQAFQKGKLDGDEFRSFMENMATDVKERLAKELGADDVGELFKMSEQGKLVAKDLAMAFKKIAPEIRERMLSMPMTISQGVTIATNEIQTFIADLNRESGAVTSIAKSIVDGFKAVKTAINDLVKLLGGASNTIRIFGIIAAVALAPFIASLILGAVMALPMIAAVVLIGLAIDDVITYLRGGESIFGRFLAWMKGGSLGAGILVGALTLLGAAFTAWGITTAIAFAKAGFAALAFGVNAAIGLLSVLWLPALIVAGIIAIIAIIYLLWSNWDAIWASIGDIAAKTWASISDGFLGMVNTLKGYWNDFKSFFGVGVSTNITAGKVAGAASSAGGVAGAGNQTNANVTINQELPPGTTKETADAAKSATKMAMAGNGIDFITGGMGAYSQ